MISFHSYLSNRITSSDEKPVTIVDWNAVNGLIAYGQTNGGVTISRVSDNKDQPGLYKITNITSLTTHKHEITALCWNSRFNRLITGDRSGLSVVWVERDSKWFPTILSSATGSAVTSIGTSYTGEFTAITYENGQISCGDLGSNQKWVSKYEGIPKKAFWSGSGKTLYISDQNQEIYAVKDHGTDFQNYEIDLPDAETSIVFAEWNHAEHPQLLIVYENGDIFIHTKGNPENSIIHTGVKISAATWSKSGKFFAFGGNVDNGRCQVQFYTIDLNPIRTINVPAQQITSLSFNRTDTQLAIGVDRSIAIAQLLPINMWDFFDNTIVYAVHRNFSKLFDIVFFNINTNSRHIKSIDNLTGVCASKNSVLIASKTGDNETSLLILDKSGIPLASNFIQMECKLFAKTDNFAIALSDSRLCLWDFVNDDTKFVSLPADSSAVCAQGNKLFIGFTSDEVIAFEIPSCEEIGKYNVGSHVEKISVSSDMTRVSMVDIFGGLSFIDIHSGKIAGKPRKETWSMKWAEDSQDLFVALERQKLYVYHDFNATEAINSLTYICRFSGLEILTVDFTKLLLDPLNPKPEHFHTYETKLLRDVKLLTKSPDVPVEEIVKHIRNFPHKKLWKVFGEWAMMGGHYSTAEKAFTESQSQSELQFVRKVKTIVDKNIQKGFSQWCFGYYEEAQQTFITNNGLKFAIEMWATLGNWERVLQLKPPSDIATRAHIALANNLYLKGDFESAADHYMNAVMYEDAIRCYSMVADIENLVKVMNALGTDDKLLIDLGCKFTELGICESAVASFLKAGDAAKAVAACIHLNRWDDAVKLSEQHKEVSKKDIMGQYAHYLAGNSQNALATKMLVKFELFEDVANLLASQAAEAIKYNNFLFAKKCFVRAAFLYERCNKPTDDIWFKIEALHYLMLASRSIYQGNHAYAIYCSIATKEYSSFLGEERIAALIALAGYYSRNFKQCSNGFITLEHSEKFLPNKQRRIKLLAVKIFDKNQPIDEYKCDIKCPKCGENTFNMFECACSKCDFKSKRSVASGKPITAKSWRCSKCHHFATFEEMRDQKCCPLCHSSTENRPTKMKY